MKKGQIFDIAMIIVVLGAMIAVSLVASSVETKTMQFWNIGQRAFALQKAYGQADLAVQYAKMCARWSAGESVQELGMSGGHIAAQCGKSGVSVLWNKKDRPLDLCVPDAYSGFYSVMNRKINDCLALAAKGKMIPYDFLASDEKLIGIASFPAAFQIIAPSEYVGYRFGSLELRGWILYQPQTAGTYFFRPNFEIPFSYDLGVYRKLGVAAANIVASCGSSDDVSGCIKNQLLPLQEEIKEKWTVAVGQDRQDMALWHITVWQDSRETVYTGSLPPEIRFGLYVPEAAP